MIENVPGFYMRRAGLRRIKGNGRCHGVVLLDGGVEEGGGERR